MTTHRRRPGATPPRRPTVRPRRPSAPQPRRPISEVPPEPGHLISGYATETLSGEEQRQLYGAALDDQEIFDQLVEEEAWRKVFSSPGARQELLQTLEEAPPTVTAPGIRRPGIAAGRRPGGVGGPGVASGRHRESSGGASGWLGGLRSGRKGRGRYVPPMVMGTAAAALLAVALIPSWSQLGVGSVSPGDEAQRAAASSSAELVPKGFDATPDAGVAETPVSDFVPKSFGSPGEAPRVERQQRGSSTRSLVAKSPSRVMNVSYVLELNQPVGPREVSDARIFRGGDQFRLRLDVDFTAWIYLFNRTAGEAMYAVLYPHTANEQGPIAPSTRDIVLPSETWLTMDATPEDEQLVLVIATEPLTLAEDREVVSAAELDARLAEAENRFASLNWRRSKVGERVQLAIEDAGTAGRANAGAGDRPAVVVRLLGR